MEKNKSKYFTIMIIPHSEKKSVVLNVPVNIFKYLSIALILLSVFSIMFIKQYYDYREEAQYAQRSIVENKSLSREFAVVARDAIELREKVARIEELDQEIRKANEFDPTKSYFSQQSRVATVVNDQSDKSKVTASSMLATEAQGAVQEVKDSLPMREESLQEVQTLLEERHQELAAIPSIWPSSGKMVSGFGMRSDPFTYRPEFHTGIDVANRNGTPIYATADGRVTYAKYDGGYGRSILISHGKGVSTRYAHLSRYAVQPGDQIKKGALIGYMGATGRATGTHLHYEVLVNGNAIDPYKYLP